MIHNKFTMLLFLLSSAFAHTLQGNSNGEREKLHLPNSNTGENTQEINLYNNQLSFLPIEAKYWTNVQKINLWSNQLTSLTTEVNISWKKLC